MKSWTEHTSRSCPSGPLTSSIRPSRAGSSRIFGWRLLAVGMRVLGIFTGATGYSLRSYTERYN
jgi:hypothetical protein